MANVRTYPNVYRINCISDVYEYGMDSRNLYEGERILVSWKSFDRKSSYVKTKRKGKGKAEAFYDWKDHQENIS